MTTTRSISNGTMTDLWRCGYLLLLLLAASVRCQSSNRRALDSVPPVTESLQYFSREIYKMLMSQENAVVSPLSLHSSLSLTALGAKGSTQEQILQTLRLSPDSLRRSGSMATMLAKLREDNADVVMDMANFLWVPRGVAIKGEFARTIQEVFQTRVRDADFSRSEDVRQLVNRRINNMTRGHIQEILPPGAITPQTRMLLANAVYFKAAWLHPFDPLQTFGETFFTGDGGRSMNNIPMMHGSDLYQGGIFDDLDAKAIFMPYEDNRYGLLMVLPNRDNGLNDLERALMNLNYTPTTLLRKMIQRDVNITLPRFQVKYNVEMSAVLQKMGIVDLFNDADLSAMSSSAISNRLKVSNVFHQATIEVNEGGSEASAASGLEITPLIGGFGKYTGPIEFKADHPFMFYLIDRDNDNIPLFMGRMVNPLQEHVTDFNRNRLQEVQFQPVVQPIPHVPAVSVVPAVPNLNRNRLTSPNVLAPNRVTPIRNRPLFSPDLEEIIFASAGSPYQGLFNQLRRNSLLTELLINSLRQDVQNNPVLFPEDTELLRSRRDTVSAEATTAQTLDTRVENINWFKKPPHPSAYVPLDSTTHNSHKPITTTPTSAATPTPPRPFEFGFNIGQPSEHKRPLPGFPPLGANNHPAVPAVLPHPPAFSIFSPIIFPDQVSSRQTDSTPSP